jgi:catechol 2,3-dioxygenase-like lactoylglutathione lyase family enzyme
MSTNEVGAAKAAAASIDMKFEIVVIPVSDVDRAKEFYARLGWRLDADYENSDDYRVIQFTPPGSGCSVIFGKNVTAATPGSAQGLYLIVSDVTVARQELLAHGVEVSEIFHDAGGVYAGTDQPYLFGRRRVSGPDPERRSYRSFLSFNDPDGNGWLVQEIRERLPGRGGRIDVAALAQLLQEAGNAHGAFEAIAPKHDWYDWYAAYMDARERGSSTDDASSAATRYMADVKHVSVTPA